MIGGGLAQAGPALFEPARRTARRTAQLPPPPGPRARRLGDDAGLLGTALAARDLATARSRRQTVILTVTPNPALDLTWHVDRLTPGATHRVPSRGARAGGKGLNVARVLHSRGARGARPRDGRRHDRRASSPPSSRRSGIPHRLVPVAGATRRSIAIVDEASGETTRPQRVRRRPRARRGRDPHRDGMSNSAAASRAVAISGSLPAGLRRRRSSAHSSGSSSPPACPSSSTRAGRAARRRRAPAPPR